MVLAAYDPLSTLEGKPKAHDLVATERDGGAVSIRLYLPARRVPSPVILMSNDAGEAPFADEALARHWAARGFVVVLLVHTTDDLGARVREVRGVIDVLLRWQNEGRHLVTDQRLDLDHLGFLGRGLGAVVGQSLQDARVSALVLMSPLSASSDLPRLKVPALIVGDEPSLRASPGPRYSLASPFDLKALEASSSAFFDATLRGDLEAQRWLEVHGALAPR
jgi:dienelactone hydrolase